MANNATTQKLTNQVKQLKNEVSDLNDSINNLVVNSLDTELILQIFVGGILVWVTGFGIGLLIQVIRRLKL